MAAALRTLCVLVVAAGMLVLSPSTSWACSCVATTPAAQAERAETVVDGTLEWIASNGMESTYSVRVDHVYKGRAAVHEKLVSPASEAACGLGALATEERYLFFVNGRHPGQMKVDQCGGSTRYDPRVAAAIESVTGPPGGPVVAPVVRGAVDPDPIEGTRWYTVVGTTLVVGLVLGGLLLYARGSGRR